MNQYKMLVLCFFLLLGWLCVLTVKHHELSKMFSIQSGLVFALTDAAIQPEQPKQKKNQVMYQHQYPDTEKAEGFYFLGRDQSNTMEFKFSDLMTAIRKELVERRLE